MEKDYVNSWVLHAVYTSPLRDMVFKGGTALSKLYFPRTWRFSEDLDFTFTGEITEEQFIEGLRLALEETEKKSGIRFTVRSTHLTPAYVQAKVQYEAVLGHRNTTKLDVTLDEHLVFEIEEKPYSFEDVPPVTIKAYSLEEILVEKIRSLFERNRARDFYDTYKILKTSQFDPKAITEALKEKMRIREMTPRLEINEARKHELKAYWDTSLDRLISTAEKPEFSEAMYRVDEFIEQLKATDEDLE